MKKRTIENACYLLDLERSIVSGKTTYWKAHKRGYTTEIREAGYYSEEEADQIIAEDIDKRTVKIPLFVVNRLKERFII